MAKEAAIVVFAYGTGGCFGASLWYPLCSEAIGRYRLLRLLPNPAALPGCACKSRNGSGQLEHALRIAYHPASCVHTASLDLTVYVALDR
jgi:hypothetical protein